MSNPLLKEFKESVNEFKKIMKIGGIDVIDENFKFSWRLLITTIIAFTVTFCTFYSLFVTISTSDFDAMMKIGFVVKIAVQAMPRIFVIIIWHKKIRCLFAKIELTYKMTSTAKGCDILAGNLRVFRLVGKSVTIAYVVAACLYVAPPAFYYIFYGKRILITELYLPGVDHKTNFGFAVLTIFHLVGSCSGCTFYINFRCHDHLLFLLHRASK
jgi:hypothetical protein